MHRFGDIAIVVKDARASSKWYHEKLGWTVGASDGHWVTVRPRGSAVTFHLCEHRPLERGNTGIGFVTDDLRREVRRLTARGVRFPKGIVHAEWGDFAFFRDPDGNEFWLLPA